MIRREQTTITTSGSAGSATGSATVGPIAGHLLAIHLDYSASQAATTDVTIAAASPAVTLLVRSNSATDGLFLPRAQANAPADASAITGVYDTIPVVGYVTISVAQGNNAQTVTVTLFYEG